MNDAWAALAGIVGVIGTLCFVSFTIASCVAEQERLTTAKMEKCVEVGGSWVFGSCIVVVPRP